MQAISENHNQAAQPLEDEAPSVHLHAARLSYRGETIFDDLDLHLPARRTTCLLGPSGVGKTSLLRMVAGLTHAAQGEAVDAEGKGLEGRVAYMAQQDLLLPWRNIISNIEFGLESRGVGKEQRRARAMQELKHCHLEGFDQQYPYQLSGGMRQRAALARTLAIDPEIILLDEPMAGMGAEGTARLTTLLSGLKREAPILLIEHDMDAVFALADRISVLVYGKVIATGAVDEIRNHPEVRTAYLGEET